MKSNKNKPSNGPFFKFKDQVEKIFEGKINNGNYWENFEDKMIIIDLEAEVIISFSKLNELSQILGTNKIDFCNYTDDMRYSSWTYDPGEPTRIKCYDVNFNNQ